MKCNCSVVETILAALIIIFAVWNTWVYANWVVIIAAVLLLLHGLFCKACKACHSDMDKMPMKGSKRRR